MRDAVHSLHAALCIVWKLEKKALGVKMNGEIHEQGHGGFALLHAGCGPAPNAVRICRSGAPPEKSLSW